MSGKKPTHYEILGVKEGCTSQEIRSAFLNLSKAHHPDLHVNDPSKHSKYVRIMEAYTVLRKSKQRSIYDSDLRHWASQPTRDYDVESNAPHYSTWKDESIWEMRDRGHDKFYEGRSYYGVKGINRVSNQVIAVGAVFLMAAGALCTFIALKQSRTFTVTQLDRKDIRLAKELKSSQTKAQQNGNEVQLNILKAKLAEQQD